MRREYSIAFEGGVRTSPFTSLEIAGTIADFHRNNGRPCYVQQRLVGEWGDLTAD